MLRRAFLTGVVVLTAGMALVVPLHSGIVAQSNSVPGAVAAFFAIALGTLLPFVIFLFISASVPGPDFWYWETIFATKERPGVTASNEGAYHPDLLGVAASRCDSSGQGRWSMPGRQSSRWWTASEASEPLPTHPIQQGGKRTSKHWRMSWQRSIRSLAEGMFKRRRNRLSFLP